MLTTDTATTESQLLREIESGIVEAARLRRAVDQATASEDHRVLSRQLDEAEKRVESLRRRLAEG